MHAAIYARKSNEQSGVATEAKSVIRQIENARAFAAKRGWTVDDAYVFVDDGKSGAEFKRREGFQRLMGSLFPTPPFNVLIVSEQKSIGREMSETAMVIKQLAQAGVEIFEYGQGTSLTPKNWSDKAMSAMRSAADEAHREDTRMRVHEAHLHKVERGYCVGGRVFGYRNEDVTNGVDHSGRLLRSHVVRKVERSEAAVVVKIFKLYASGLGLKAIAKRLNSERAVTPTPFVRRDPSKVQPVQGWAPATIRAILGRELYRGVIVWNRSRKRDDWGQVDQKPRPQSDWKRVLAPDLRIVSDDLWTRVASRRADTEGKTLRFASGRISGRPPIHATKNLLAGLATCALCGGGLVVETSKSKRGRKPEYICHRHRANGTCANVLRVPVEEMNEAVLQAIEEHALTPAAVERVIQLTEMDDVQDRYAALVRERKAIDKRIANLVAAIEGGANASSLSAKLSELEARREAIDREQDGLRPIPRLAPKVVNDRLAEWRRQLRGSMTQGRAVLQRILSGRITFTPTGAGYEFTAPTRFDRLFSGLVVPRSVWAQPRAEGCEGIEPEDVYYDGEADTDYGRLLERAYSAHVKGVASLPGPTPFNVVGAVGRRVA